MDRLGLQALPQIVPFQPSRRSRCGLGDSFIQIKNGGEGSFHALIAYPVQMTAQDVRIAATGIC